MLRTLLECLGKPDKRREERDQSGQELHEINQIGHLFVRTGAYPYGNVAAYVTGGS